MTPRAPVGSIVVGACAWLSCAWLGCAPSCQPSQADLALARSITPNFMRAAEGRDPAAAAALYDPDATVMPPGMPPVRGRPEIQAFWQKMMLTAIRKVTLDPADLQMCGDIAYETGNYTLEMTLPDGSPATDAGKYIVLMKRQADGSWKMTRDMWSSNGAGPVRAGH